jgi:hypothetical protein
MASAKQSLLRTSSALLFVLTVAALLLLAVTLLPLAGGATARSATLAPFAVSDHRPVTHEVGVPLSAVITATFDADVDATTVTSRTFVLHGHMGGLASGTFTYDGGTRTVTLDPDRSFHAGEVLRVAASNAISSTGGTALSPYGWQFTAGEVYSRFVAGFADIGAVLTRMYYGSVAWGDYDNDGDLDILLAGATSGGWPPDCVSKVYRNDGGGAFTDIGAGLGGVFGNSAAWGDFDNDGDLDILLTGYWNGSKVYRNDGGGAFTDISAGLPFVGDSCSAWGDYDNDGDLDILLTGYDLSNPVSKLYRNDGGGAFSETGAGLVGVSNGSVAWGDYDNDGDLDILLTGSGASGLGSPVSKVYRNDGGGTFTDIAAALTAVELGSVAWGDYDRDGELDILLTGWTASSRVSKVYRNNGGTFADIGAGLTGVGSSSAAWGDYDNDGDLDILLTGCTDASCHSSVSKVYRNDGGTFTDIGAALTGVHLSSVAWGDYDNDGDLDILLAGSSSSGYVSKVYRNNSTPKLGAVTPSSGSGTAGATTHFTTTWSDPDGWENLKQCYFHIGAGPSLAGNVTLLYNAATNKLWLLSDDGTEWEGGCPPGGSVIVFNSQVELHCSQTAVRGAGDRLGVRWAIKFKSGYAGDKKLGLKCKDVDKATAKGAWKGTWTIE